MFLLRKRHAGPGNGARFTGGGFRSLGRLKLTDQLSGQTRGSNRQGDGTPEHNTVKPDGTVFAECLTRQLDDKDAQLELLKEQLAQKDQLLYELFSCAHEMLHLEERQKEVELQYMGELLADHFLGCYQVSASPMAGEANPVIEGRGHNDAESARAASGVPDDACVGRVVR